MIGCLIIGDSIAFGTKQATTQQCVSYAHSGWNTWQWNTAYLDKGLDFNANTIVISLGTNDYQNLKTEAQLRKMRKELHGNNVIWIMPQCINNPNVDNCKVDLREIVQKVADEHHDIVIKTDKLGHDHIHPNASGYKELAKEAGLK